MTSAAFLKHPDVSHRVLILLIHVMHMTLPIILMFPHSIPDSLSLSLSSFLSLLNLSLSLSLSLHSHLSLSLSLALLLTVIATLDCTGFS